MRVSRRLAAAAKVAAVVRPLLDSPTFALAADRAFRYDDVRVRRPLQHSAMAAGAVPAADGIRRHLQATGVALTRSWSEPSGAMVIISVACFASACRGVNIGVSSWWCPVRLVNRCRWLAASSRRPGCDAACAGGPRFSAQVETRGAAAFRRAGWASAACGGRPPAPRDPVQRVPFEIVIMAG